MSWTYDSADLTTATASGRLKLCSKCEINLPTSQFHKDSSRDDGLRTTCKDCKAATDREYRQKNTDKIRDRQSQYYEGNKDLFLNHNAKRRARKMQATPKWLSPAQEAHIKRTYKLRTFIEEVTGEKYHVDHIVPLNGKSVCGLHVPWNLEVIQAKENLQKSNKFEG